MISNRFSKAMLWSVALLICSFAGLTAAQSGPQPADVSGHWTIYARNPNGTTDTKMVEIQQNGTDLTGKFKGRNQSGKIVGSVNGHRVNFQTRTREVMRFWGLAEGDTIRGTFGIRGRHGEFEARRDGQ